MMKKGICALLALSMLLLAGCGGKNQDTQEQEQALTQAQAAAEQLRLENEALQAKVTELMGEQEALLAQRDTLLAQLDEAQQTPAPMPQPQPTQENPIDAFYDAALAEMTATVEMSLVASLRSDAWYDELNHLAEVIKGELHFDEDKALVDSYVIGTAERMELMNPMVLFVCADTTVPQSDRMMTAGTIRSVLWCDAAASIYRDTFYQLMAVNPAEYWEGTYTFAFDAENAQTQLEGALAQ